MLTQEQIIFKEVKLHSKNRSIGSESNTANYNTNMAKINMSPSIG